MVTRTQRHEELRGPVVHVLHHAEILEGYLAGAGTGAAGSNVRGVFAAEGNGGQGRPSVAGLVSGVQRLTRDFVLTTFEFDESIKSHD